MNSCRLQEGEFIEFSDKAETPIIINPFSVVNPETMKKSPEYKKFLKDSVDRAVSELGDGSIIHLLKGDKENISKMKNVSIVEDLNGLGGAIVESSDGKVIVDLSLETLYELRKDDLRKQISEKLFG
jgi:vacuolar-type H+-ATPase subunit E/Vma4